MSLNTGQGECIYTAAYWHCCMVVSISLGMASNVLFLAAFQFQFDRFFEPTLIVASGATPAELLRSAAVLHLFGYYLATAVLAYVLWQQVRPRNPLHC